MSEIEKIGANIRRLCEWYKANKPQVNHVSISIKDAKKIRDLWENKDKRPEVAMAGFKVHDDGHLSWGQWLLKEPEHANTLT